MRHVDKSQAFAEKFINYIFIARTLSANIYRGIVEGQYLYMRWLTTQTILEIEFDPLHPATLRKKND